MSRRRRHEEPENHERWLVSYADFITLLFAFFVVMYATSSINEGKYRVLADSLISAFSGPTRTMNPIQVGEMVRTPVAHGNAPPTALIEIDAPVSGISGHGPDVEGIDEPGKNPEQRETASQAVDPQVADLVAQGPGAQMEEVGEIGRRLGEALDTFIDDELVEVRQMEDWLELEIKSSILFPSGSARLTGQAIPVLEKVAKILKEFPNPVQVEGFTDNVPINTTAYPSNWELSAGRAASVVHLFMKYNVRPERMVAIGYGEYRPIADNSTPEGRAKNRRVVLVIPADRDTRRNLELDRMEDMQEQAAVAAPREEAQG
jgi:chemotaxis protein MotB